MYKDLKENQRQGLRDFIVEATAALGLTPSDAHVSKCLQLQNSLSTRFGVILLGPATSGKTSIAMSLHQALNRLDCKVRQQTPETEAVRRHVINPKACCLNDLYGRYEEATGEWHEGLLPDACRKAMSTFNSDDLISVDKSQCPGQHTWIVLDGPVDSQWVENLNTVLDDSKRWVSFCKYT